MDVAANKRNTKCKKYLSKREDALETKWKGVCWCNPPYGRGLNLWVKKALDETNNGVKTVMLLPVRSNTNWWHDYIIPNCEVRFIRGRPKFGDSNLGLPWPMAIVIFDISA